MQSPRAILLDIEGTTTPLAFVTGVLFPYARRHLREYLAGTWSVAVTVADVAMLASQQEQDMQAGLGPPQLSIGAESEYLESIVLYVHWLMDHDRKVTPLKAIQGRIWRKGYSTGELRSSVYEDVPLSLAAWKRMDKTVAIYSSGSVDAQKLLFSHTNAGDLTSFIDAYFDTTSGPKLERQSYSRISNELKREPNEFLFVSDVTAELDAAREAGLQTLLCVREGNRPPPTSVHRVITAFDEIRL